MNQTGVRLPSISALLQAYPVTCTSLYTETHNSSSTSTSSPPLPSLLKHVVDATPETLPLKNGSGGEGNNLGTLATMGLPTPRASAADLTVHHTHHNNYHHHLHSSQQQQQQQQQQQPLHHSQLSPAPSRSSSTSLMEVPYLTPPMSSSTAPAAAAAAVEGPLKCVCRNNTETGHHIPRPRNAFILFRQHMHQQLFSKHSSSRHAAHTPPATTPGTPESNGAAAAAAAAASSSSVSPEVSFKTNSQISREIGRRWRELGDPERSYWQNLALQEKEAHRLRYPGYKYIPRKSRAGKRQRKDGCEFCKLRTDMDLH
ncbi:LAFA_0D07646g1_1 [Lachancea sp. 'fantastica']|nr:LAFA_0D07646g1_1 [Lachancea sp. 'fantastica']